MSTLQRMLYRKREGSALGILFIFILILILIFLFDMGYIFMSERCIDMGFFDCVMEEFASDDEEEEKPAGSVTATGVIAGTYGKSERTVNVSITFPLEGGDVTGSFEGDCDGSIKGSYAGGNGGAISGKAKGSCAFILPASGEFSGSVNQTTKSVFVSGKGSVTGFSGEGSLTLKYTVPEKQ